MSTITGQTTIEPAAAIVDRGNVFTFSTTFVDAAGSPVDPASVGLTLVCGADTTTLAMSESGHVWSAEWDSFGADPTFVYWSVLAVTPHCVDEGYFQLVANIANQAATS